MDGRRDFLGFKLALNAALLTFTILAGCSKNPVITNSFSVVSFDGHTHEYTLVSIHAVDGKAITKRLLARCASYAWGDREVLLGPNVCKLVVGTTLKENLTLGRKFLTFYEASANKWAMMQGIGPNRVVQQFEILKQEIIGP